jgi:hypothetical protein
LTKYFPAREPQWTSHLDSNTYTTVESESTSWLLRHGTISSSLAQSSVKTLDGMHVPSCFSTTRSELI